VLTYRALKRGYKVKEIPIVFEDRRVGKEQMSRKNFLEAVTMVWKLRARGGSLVGAAGLRACPRT
jgi:dolichol-phosphate mannosyltransferase